MKGLKCVFIIMYVIGMTAISFASDATDGLNQRSSLWKCKATHGKWCTSSNCGETGEGVNILLDFNKNEYTRCSEAFSDSYPCIKYRMDVEVDFGHTVINFDRWGGSYFISTNDGSEFVELISQAVSTITTFGNCVSLNTKQVK